MRPVTLTLIVHDHQPVGNFDGVIRAACADAYDPFLDFLERHPRLRLALHVSGPLLEWMSANRRDHLVRLRALVQRGQVEMWGGGFYEPILTAIPEVDRAGQIRALSNWIEEELGTRPRGLWLTERVWEPSLAGTLAEAGIEYTALDDAHFIAAGIERDQLWGPYVTEDQGRSIRVLPIHRDLRYRIPFEPPARTIELLAEVAAGGLGRLAVLGDDGEKFGVWPGTKATCWEQGWMDEFARALEAAPWVEIVPPGEALDRHAAIGLAYLPSASYHEMQEWALPPAAQRRHRRAAQVLAPEFGPLAHDLLRGGHWRGFLTRYPEANRLQKRMVRASRKLHALPEHDAAWREARRRLWRSQCNCAYWHGVFGGLYLPHLREAVYRELIALERYLGPTTPRLERDDIDLDGVDDALLETPSWAAWVGARGGAMWAFDDRLSGRNWGDTLARRDEAYHDELEDLAVGGAEGGTIHAAVRSTESGLATLARQRDDGPRDMFLECWMESGRPSGWAGRRFEFLEAEPHEIALRAIPLGTDALPDLTKRYRVGEGGALEADLTLSSPTARTGALDVVLNFGVHVPDSPDRFIRVNGERAACPDFGARAAHEGVRSIALIDHWEGVRLDVAVDREARLTRAPIETVSLSERGAERVFQGLEAKFSFDVALTAAQPWSVRFAIAPAAEKA